MMKRHVSYAFLMQALVSLITLGFIGSAFGTGDTGDREALPDCSHFGIVCPEHNYVKRVLFIVNPRNPNFNPQACTCNVNFVRCNANATSPYQVAKECLSGEGLKAVPFHIEGFNDGTTVCLTSGGQRRCYTQ